MTTRRGFLAAMLASGLAPVATWADAGAPTHLAAARQPDGSFVLCGLDGARGILFTIPLPDRGHAAAAHPVKPEAVAFARRPGTFAVVLDCRDGAVLARLDAPEGRHFYGHGAFSQDGGLLFTPENDYENALGRVGIWDAAHGYARVGEIASHGTGPHDIALLPGGEALVIANGGIETHPDSGRAKLNLPVMRPSLAYVDLGGDLLDRSEPRAERHLNSIRHLSLGSDGTVAFACQWQGDRRDAPPLLSLHRRGEAPRWLVAGTEDHARLDGYAGSVAFSGDGARVAITSPRGGQAQIFDAATGEVAGIVERPDICGASRAGAGFIFTTGTGEVAAGQRRARFPLAWDNHLVPITA